MVRYCKLTLACFEDQQCNFIRYHINFCLRHIDFMCSMAFYFFINMYVPINKYFCHYLYSVDKIISCDKNFSDCGDTIVHSAETYQNVLVIHKLPVISDCGSFFGHF